MKTTSERLKEVMKEKKLRQVDILEMSKKYQKELNIKMSKSHLSQYVNGKSSPDQHKLYLLSKTLNVGEAWLMGYDVDSFRVPDEERQKETIIYKINDISSQLEIKRQKVVLDTAENQLEEQQKLKDNIVDADFTQDKKNDSYDDYIEYGEVDVAGFLAAGKGTLNFDKSNPIKTLTVPSDEIPDKYDLTFQISGNSMEPGFKDGELVYVDTLSPFKNKKVYAVEVNKEAYIKKVYRDGSNFTLVSLNNERNEHGDRLFPEITLTEHDDFYIIGRIV
ncbi:S24 family peptidase [Staphylococcus xylosus]